MKHTKVEADSTLIILEKGDAVVALEQGDIAFLIKEGSTLEDPKVELHLGSKVDRDEATDSNTIAVAMAHLVNNASMMVQVVKSLAELNKEKEEDNKS